MKRTLFLAALLPLVAACSNDDVVTTSKSDEIKLAVVANSSTRATAEYSSTTLPDEFYLTALQIPTTTGSYPTATPQYYFKKDKVSKPTSGDYWTLSGGTRYWPQAGGLDFFAFYNGSTEPTYTWAVSDGKEQAKITGITTSQYAEDHIDVLYGKETCTTKPTDGTVTINLRHAMSQLEFYFQNKSENIYVEVQNVALININTKGDVTFTYPTTTQFTEATGDGTTIDTNTLENQLGTDDINSICTWDNQSWDNLSTPIVYSLKSPSGYQKDYNNSGTDAEPVRIVGTSTDNTSTDNSVKSNMMIVPQKYTGGHFVADAASTSAKKQGVYAVISCRVYNVVDPEAFENEIKNKTAEQIHEYLTTAGTDGKPAVEVYVSTDASNPDGFRNLYVPIGTYDASSTTPANEWLPGRKYTYTFVFGGDRDGSGPKDDDDNDALVPIKVKVTDDDWDNNTTQHFSQNL